MHHLQNLYFGPLNNSRIRHSNGYQPNYWVNQILTGFSFFFKKFWYLFAIEIIDTQVARHGYQYHSQPILQKKKEKDFSNLLKCIILNLPLKKNSPSRPYKKKLVY